MLATGPRRRPREAIEAALAVEDAAEHQAAPARRLRRRTASRRQPDCGSSFFAVYLRQSRRRDSLPPPLRSVQRQAGSATLRLDPARIVVSAEHTAHAAAALAADATLREIDLSSAPPPPGQHHRPPAAAGPDPRKQIVALARGLEACLQGSPVLRILRLNHVLLPPSAVRLLAKGLGQSRSLTELHLANCGLDDMSFRDLGKGLAMCSQLQLLDVSANALTADAASCLATVLKNRSFKRDQQVWASSLRGVADSACDSAASPPLRCLNLSGASLGLAGLQTLLSALACAPGLAELSLGHTRLGRKSGALLAEALEGEADSLANLVFLDLRDNPRLPETERERIRAYLVRHRRGRVLLSRPAQPALRKPKPRSRRRQAAPKQPEDRAKAADREPHARPKPRPAWTDDTQFVRALLSLALGVLEGEVLAEALRAENSRLQQRMRERRLAAAGDPAAATPLDSDDASVLLYLEDSLALIHRYLDTFQDRQDRK